MLPRVFSLKNKKDIARVFKAGKALNTRVGFVKMVPSTGTNSRFAIIIKTKDFKKAHQRNLIRRRLRAAIKQALPLLKKNLDIAIIVDKKLMNQKYTSILEDAANSTVYRS